MRAACLLLAAMVLAGCAVAPQECGPSCLLASPAYDVAVHALAVNDCPSGTTCAPIGGGAGDAELFLDGNATGTTDEWGRMTLPSVIEGSHTLCARHPHYGSSETMTFSSGAQDEPIRLLLRRDGPPCPRSSP